MGLETRLTSNNSTYKTNTGGTHSSNVHHANTDHNSKSLRKGTIDLATVNSHRVTGGAGGSAGPSRSSAGAAGGLAAGGQGGTGGHVIIHHQAPPPPPDTLTSTELLGAAIGSTILIILIIIAGAITCRSVYRDQARSYRKRKDKKQAKKARELQDQVFKHPTSRPIKSAKKRTDPKEEIQRPNSAPNTVTLTSEF